VAKLVAVFREVRRVLRDDGTLWLNLGDSYAGSWGNAGGHNRGNGSQRKIASGSVVKDQAERNGDFVPPGARGFKNTGIKPKDLIGIPWRVAFALQADGWYLRQDIIWHKPNPMPESVTDRCTKAHEYVFLLSKSARYYFDSEAMQEPSVYAGKTGNFNGKKKVGRSEQPTGNERSDAPSYLVKATRNRRSVWTVNTKPYKGAHFATFPPALIEPCVLAGSRKGGVVLDPFNGSGTTGEVAILNGRRYVGIELNAKYIKLAETRIDAAVKQSSGLLFQ
jgi:DNA modification methylase